MAQLGADKHAPQGLGGHGLTAAGGGSSGDPVAAAAHAQLQLPSPQLKSLGAACLAGGAAGGKMEVISAGRNLWDAL